MDITTTLKQKRKRPWRGWVIAGVAVVSLTGWLVAAPQVDTSLERADLWLAEVKQGDLPVWLSGYGKLKAKYQRFLTSPAQATVEEIFYHPGAVVREDTVLMRLANPQVAQQLAQAKLELERQRAALRERDISQQNAYLAREADLARLRAELESSELRVEAEASLAAKGIVSSLDFKRSQLEVRQLQERLAIERKRLVKLAEMHRQGLSAQRELVKQMQLNVEVQQQIADRLEVRAGLDGMLQAMPVELGQSVPVGGQLALVGSTHQLIAELRMPQRAAAQISLNDQAEIDTFGGRAVGEVIRIDPVVEDGRILVEVALTGELPANARPELTVDGKVLVNTLADALYIEQPAKVEADARVTLFKLSTDGRSAAPTPLQFGSLAGRFIQIRDGARAGDEFIISDTSALAVDQPLQLSAIDENQGI